MGVAVVGKRGCAWSGRDGCAVAGYGALPRYAARSKRVAAAEADRQYAQVLGRATIEEEPRAKR
jgi:hypothetical protein